MRIQKKHFTLHVFEMPRWVDAFSFHKFYNMSREPGFLFPGQKRFTMVSDLTLDKEAIFSKFSSVVRRHIKKAEDLGLEWFQEEDPAMFLQFFNSFAEKKEIAQQSSQDWEAKVVVLTGAKYEGQVLVYHAYWYDPVVSRARLRSSCSVRLEEGSDPSVVGQANRWLHWKDMQFLKAKGIHLYDWGGCKGPDAKEVDSIHVFKSFFGGEIIKDFDAVSLSYYLVDSVTRPARRFMKRAKV